MQQSNQVIAIFNPLRVTDLKPDCRKVIGEVAVWQASYHHDIDETHCPDEWAMDLMWWPEYEQNHLRGDWAWVALSDLAILEHFEELIGPEHADTRIRYWAGLKAAEIRAIRLRASLAPPGT